MRSQIAWWSHRVFWAARLTRLPGLYIGWARTALTIYQGLTWSRGPIGSLIDKVLPKTSWSRRNPPTGS